MQYKKSTKSASSNPVVVFGSSQYKQLSGNTLKAGCGCGKKKKIVKE
ncbi:hypothetical protein [Peribacillus frigoritolerans]|nr:hypothetical protein [Peribacillus frigoritolerans]